ncbi:hypothetical protein ACFV5G_25720 [Streptomyces sp. NPDC059766]|uniref:hypothetical protein n=1 Tax=Streptomyces sp. NPDC059766 TaxID=3346940 RepID=UPI003646517B
MGAVFWALALGGAVAALWLADRYNLGIAQTVVALATTSAGLYLSWAAYHADRRAERRELTLEEVASSLAEDVSAQWERELNVRQVHHPGPLPVAWTAVDTALVDSWDSIRSLASSWPGYSAEDARSWAEGPQDLASPGLHVDASLVLRVPTRRLVLVGERGAGKSVLLIRLLLSLARQRERTGRVPVLFSLSSWNPYAEDLRSWMERTMARDHRYLNLPSALHGSSGSRASELLDHGMVLPILDGFDEIPAGARTVAMDAFNDWLLMGQPVVLSSRPEEFRTAVRAGTRLSGAAGVGLVPLTPQDIESHLVRGARGDVEAAHGRWAPLLQVLTTPESVPARCLSRPLMLFLAGALYNAPRDPYDRADPREMCDASRFPDPSALERHLQRAFVPAVYRNRPREGRAVTWSPEQAQRILQMWARGLRERSSHDLAWWNMIRLLPRRVRVVTLLLVGATIGPLVAVPVAWAVRSAGAISALGLLAGLGAGGAMVAAALVILGDDLMTVGEEDERTPTLRQRWTVTVSGLAVGLTAGWASWVVLGPSVGLMLGCTAGFVESLLSGLRTLPVDGSATAESRLLFQRDRRAFFATLLGVSCAVGSPTGVLATAACGVAPACVLGLCTGLATGFISALSQSRWAQYTLGCQLLALLYGYPRDMMTFIHEAHTHYGVLRQAGAVYQFRHVELERALAADNEPRWAGATAMTGGAA